MAKSLFPDLNLDLQYRPVTNTSPRVLTRGQVDAYNRDGYFTHVPMLSGDRLREVQEFFLREKERVIHKGEGFECFHHVIPELHELVTDPLLVSYMRDLLGPDVVCHISQFIRKEPGQGPEVTWHQDSSFNPGDARCVVVWLAVEDADVANGCMWFIPGSHRLGQLACDDRHTVASAEQQGKKVPIELKAGEVVIFSDLLLHASPANKSSRPRPGFTMTFVAADVPIHKNKNRWGVVCCGEDRFGYWPAQTQLVAQR